MVNHSDVANTSTPQVQGNGGSQTASTNDQGMRGQQLLLTFNADIVQENVARIAQ
jgi:hypothetical protein